MHRIVLGLAVLLLVAACGGRPAPDATGAEIFSLECARCHGGELQGRVGPALGPGSDAVQRSDEFLTTTIVRGRGRMPSFGQVLTPEQVTRLVGYLRQKQAGG